MPCRDYYDDHPEKYFTDVTEPALKKQIAFAESALCAALDALDRIPVPDGPGARRVPTLDMIDYASAGITKQELVAWRKKHKELDQMHRAQEQKRIQVEALAKLSPAEKEALKNYKW